MKGKTSRSELVAVGKVVQPLQSQADGQDFAEFFEKKQQVWAEPQLFLLPFCVPQDKTADRFRSIKITETVRVDDQVKQRTFKVNPDPEWGLPGSFELEVMTGIYQVAAEYMAKHGSVPERLELGSFRSFLQLIGRPYSGKYAAMLKEALKRLAATNCVSEGFFYSKPRDLYIIKSFQFITAAEIAGEDDHNGGRFSHTAIYFHPFIRENLNSNFRTLIDFEYLRSLRTDIAKTLSLHLSYRFYKQGKSIWEADYHWLAERLAIKIQKDLCRARDQLRPALKELQSTGFIESWEWLENARIRFIAGSRCVAQHKIRVLARDAWLEHDQTQVRQLSISSATERNPERSPAYDPLAAICAEYAVHGWTPAIADKANARELDETTLRKEAVDRGHCL